MLQEKFDKAAKLFDGSLLGHSCSMTLEA